MKISLGVFKIRGFEGRIWVPKHGGPRNSTGAGLLNYQTSKFSLFCLMNQNLLMSVLNLRFRRGNWAPNVWETLELPGALISNHQVSIFSLFALKSENLLFGVCNLRFRRWNWTLNEWGTSKFCTRPQFEITKHLYLAHLAQ
jgi:hypothetical protein